MKGGICGAITAAAVCLIAVLPARAQYPRAAPPPAPGMARVWLLRPYEPYRSLAEPTVFANAAPLAVSLPGTAVYRDLPPGNYVFSVASDGWDYDQEQRLWLSPGAQAFLEVFVNPEWASGLTYRRDTFYVRLILPERAAQELTRLRDLGGG